MKYFAHAIVFSLVFQFVILNTKAYGFEDGFIEDIFRDDENYTVEYLIESEGYPVETHKIATSDGYILTLHRIPHGRKNKTLGKVAFLQHGILASSADWVVMGAKKSLAFILADEGYDVWMGNARGNTQSRAHEKLDPDKDMAFWDFTWHEIGIYDVPEMIDYILCITGMDGVYYVGHCQGSTNYYVMTTMLPEYNSKIKVQVSLAPAGYMGHLTSPLMRYMAFWDFALERLLPLIGDHEFLPNNEFMKIVMSDVICAKDSVTQWLCENTVFALCGFTIDEMNTTLLPIIMKYSPAGSSTKQILHYAQEVQSNHFRQYDYGTLGNMAKYHALWPPDYDLSKITAPTYLMYSRNDWLSAEVDVQRLCLDMKHGCRGNIPMTEKQFNNLDFMFGNDAPNLIYSKVVSLLARH